MQVVHAWRNHFAQTAEDAVKKMIEDDPYLTTKDEISQFVTFLIGNEAAQAPFVYETWSTEDASVRRSVSF